ncbi:MAG TPA: hypothetical protein VNT75_31335 [Symbiobacteriaceae bacterium]|nr:hypothetical protein [Symbiobacteriaceae bacterium]
MDWTFWRKLLIVVALVASVVITTHYTDKQGWTRFRSLSFGVVVAVCMLYYQRFFSPADQAVAAYKQEAHDEEAASGDGSNTWEFTSLGGRRKWRVKLPPGVRPKGDD